VTGDRPPAEFLADIASYASDAVNFAVGHSRESFEADKKTLYAVEWCLAVIGEAGKRLPVEVRQRSPAMPWRGMMGMRDRLVHGYFSLGLDYIWQTVTEDLPVLIPAVRQLHDELTAVPQPPPPPEAP
jgi:uncharacterized protein with HEPN domain